MITIIKFPEALAKTGGVLRDFFIDRLVDGFKATNDSDNVILTGKDQKIYPPFIDLVNIVVAGGSFTNVLLAVKIANTQANVEVPEGLLNRMITPEDEDERVKTWLEWLNSGGVKYYTNGTLTIFKAFYGALMLNSEQLTIIHTLPNAEVIDWHEYLTLQTEYTAE